MDSSLIKIVNFITEVFNLSVIFPPQNFNEYSSLRQSVSKFNYLYFVRINQSQFQTSNTELLENEQFENLLVGFYLTSRFMTASYLRSLIGEMENTMELIDARIEALANAQAN